MDEEVKELMTYRLNRAWETLEVAKKLFAEGKYRDANNRSYYVATQIFPREFGKRISTLALIREQSDYNDFYVASKQESQQQVEIAEELVTAIDNYIKQQKF